MTTKRFPWGKVIERSVYDFDGTPMTVVKYHPWQRDGCKVIVGDANLDEVMYSCEELHELNSSLYYLLLSWIAYKQLGINQPALVAGVARALKI